jgi:hypothetical protein
LGHFSAGGWGEALDLKFIVRTTQGNECSAAQPAPLGKAAVTTEAMWREQGTLSTSAGRRMATLSVPGIAGPVPAKVPQPVVRTWVM